MIRKAKAIWRGTGRAGNGNLTTATTTCRCVPTGTVVPGIMAVQFSAGREKPDSVILPTART